MIDALYSVPMWLLGVLIVGLSIVLSMLGLAVADRYVPAEARRSHNDIAGYISNIAAFVYAVLLAFLAVAVWQDYEKAQSIVQLEANAAGDVYRQAEGYPEPLRSQVRQDIRRYLDIVITEEWPLQARGGESPIALETIEVLHRLLLTFEPTSERDRIVHTEQLGDMNALLDQRRNRIYAGESGLQPVVWVVILAGSALIVAFCPFMGTLNHRAHFAMTAILGASIGLVLFLIVALDRPFRGVGISPIAFVRVRDHTLVLPRGGLDPAPPARGARGPR